MSIALLVLAISSAPSGPAPARSDASAVRDEAAAAFAAGSAAFERNDYAAALVEFQRANRLVPHPKVRSNIALCLAELGRHREAIAEFEAALAGAGLSDAERKLATDYLARSRDSLATLRVLGDADLAVDIDTREHCTTPCVLALDPGRHEVAIAARGYTTEIDLVAGQSARVTVPPAASVAPTLSADARADVPATPAKPVRVRPSALTWIGIAFAGVGGAGTIGFGVRARALHGDYLALPDADVRRRGVLLRDLANASIAVAATGALLVVVDAIRMGVRKRRGSTHTSRRHVARGEAGRVWR